MNNYHERGKKRTIKKEKQIEILIPIMIGSNGKWASVASDSAKEHDWVHMEGYLDSSDYKAMAPIYPNVMKKCFIKAIISIPSEELEIIPALETINK